MSLADTNKVIHSYLTTSSAKVDALIALVGERIYCPRLPEKIKLSDGPAISFFTRGGTSTPYIPGIPEPSVQFDCWATDVDGGKSGSMKAREVYRALYDALQGIQNVSVASPSTVIGTDSNDYYCILAHTANARNKPITGTLTATYWTATGGTGMGDIWVTGAGYSPTHEIMSAIEEVQGQDLVDQDIQNYFRTLCFFSVMIRAE